MPRLTWCRTLRQTISLSDSKALLAYLRDCLAEERARSGVPSVYASKIRSRRIIKGEERALFSEFGSIDLPPSELSALAMTAGLLQRDTDLFYSSIFIASQDQGKTLYTPVLLYPVEVLDFEKKPELRIEHNRVSLNPALAPLFELPAEFENEILSLLPTGELNLATPGLLAEDLAKHIPKLDRTPFENFPKLLSNSQIQAHSATDHPVLLPASALILVEKSKNVSGLLHELQELLSQPDETYPPALQAILGQEIEATSETDNLPVQEFAPAILSPAQRRLLHSANKHPLTVCHGPPGTGKSFTISATALDQVARGHSILIACRSDEAAAVIESKINDLIPRSQLVIRAGRRKHLRKLKNLLDQLIARKPGPPSLPSAPEVALKAQNKLVDRTKKKLSRRQRNELQASTLFHTSMLGLWQKFLRWKHLQTLSRAPLMAQLLSTILGEQEKKLHLLRAYNEQAHQRHLNKHVGSLHSRDTLKRYREAIGRRVPSSQERDLLSLDLEALVNFLPIWVTTTDDIHRVLPLKPGAFDLVIIDEATQCDLASALPILYRGKRALITGDPRQLRHLSFLSQDRLSSLADKHRLSVQKREDYNFRRVSFLDRALAITAGSDALNFLDEHFRSLPPLIAFSNEHFYQGNLHCMREVEMLSRSTHEPILITHQVSGERDTEGVNDKEITAALDCLLGIVRREKGQQPSSLGFLSPFRNQVDAFQKRLQKEVAPADQIRLRHNHQLIVGTAHSFQGAERDVMVISLALDAETPSAARRFLERPDVFNVSITRARHRIHLFSSISPGELPTDSLLCQYLVHAAADEQVKQTRPGHKDLLPTGLLEKLANYGWELLETQGTVAGMPVDLLLRSGNKLIAIDLIGTPDSLGQAVSVEKALLLKRAGLPLFPLSLAELERREEDFFDLLPT